MSEEPSNIMSTTAQVSENGYMGSAFSHLHYAWQDFETEEDLAEAELYEAISGRAGNNDLSSPLRDPELPLDEGDLQRFDMRTTRMASLSDNCSEFASIPPTPYLQPTVSEDDDYDRLSDSLSSLPRPLSAGPGWPWGSYDRFSDSLSSLPRPLSAEPGWQGVDTAHNHIACQCCEFKGMIEDRQIQHEERVADVIGKLITRIDELIAQRLPPRESHQLTEAQPNINSATSHPLGGRPQASREPTSTISAPQTPDPEPTVLELYTQAWRKGGLILVENIPDSAPARVLHALLEQCGRITYLELHGANKSGPYLPTRHAYIHYAVRSEALSACTIMHGVRLKTKTLMVFPLNTGAVRGEPGAPYIGPAIEVLNFNGGPNYTSPEAFRDLCQVHENEYEDKDTSMPASRPTTRAATYSIRPQLTAKTAAASWRTPGADTASEEVVGQLPGESANGVEGDEEVVFTGNAGWIRLSASATIGECGDEDDVGGVPLASEIEVEGEMTEPQSDDGEDLRYCVPAETVNFV
ncbi:MAG: hypothetical protein LQ348_003694 [Seirophora lacunosa]|nr:MAG: hypothetical protein LQ348_003694 [Seirophora lacunosa]